MSGHSKWSNIRRKKEASDAAKGAVFTKFAKEIAVAVKAGGPDPAGNSRLKVVVAKAKAANMPNDNINRAIKKGTGELGGESYEELQFEGYGPCGVAVIVEALTDNKNRTASFVRSVFDKNSGNLGTPGCVSYMFSRKGVVIVDSEDLDEDEVMMVALDAGADDMIVNEDNFEIRMEPQAFNDVHQAIKDAGYEIFEAEIEQIPSMEAKVEDESAIKSLTKLITSLEDNDDVQKVYYNCDLDLE
jgi:YebC/PmpR family DNA-binding regulatory protein